MGTIITWKSKTVLTPTILCRKGLLVTVVLFLSGLNEVDYQKVMYIQINISIFKWSSKGEITYPYTFKM